MIDADQSLETARDCTHSRRRVGLTRFISLFGTPPYFCAIIWQRLEELNLHPHGARPIHLLCALLFLKLYMVGAGNSSIANMDEKTFRKWTWRYIELMADGLDLVS